MDLMLKDKVAVVTGASRGIGQAIAMDLAAAGCHVACIATSEERVADTVAAVEKFGVKAKAYGCNVADFASVQEMSKKVLEDLGPIDILVNNAGVTRDQLLLRMTQEDWSTVIDVNLGGCFNTSKAFAKTLMKRVETFNPSTSNTCQAPSASSSLSGFSVPSFNTHKFP